VYPGPYRNSDTLAPEYIEYLTAKNACSYQRGRHCDLVSQQAGNSLHAGIACKSHQRKKLERPGGVPLCRYITRPAIAERRLSLANNRNVVIALKTPYDGGTSHVVLSPMEFMGRLAALVLRPRANLTRFHGVFSRGGLPPNSKLREHVVPQKPVEEQEDPKPKAYSRPGRVRMGAAAQACVRHRNREM
jgi:hypothetical protein